jgi:DNA-binding NarL/FixJ family response regulator
VVVADVATFGLPAPEVERLVARESPQTKIVFLNAQEQTSSQPGLESATAGCAVRQTSAEELVEIVRNSCRASEAGHHEANPASSLLSRRDQHLRAEAPFPQERILTAREQEVLKLLAEGKTVRAAAIVLGLSSKTVDAHKFNLMRKLGIHNKAELVMWAIQKRVVKLPANF